MPVAQCICKNGMTFGNLKNIITTLDELGVPDDAFIVLDYHKHETFIAKQIFVSSNQDSIKISNTLNLEHFNQ